MQEEFRDPLAAGHRVTGWKRYAYLTGAGFFFLLGGLGVLLPGLPATPFLLLTSYLLLRTSPRLHAALLRSRLFGPILKDWQQYGGVRLDVKIKSIVAVILVVALTLWLSDLPRYGAWAVVALAAIGLLVIWRLPVARRP